MPFEHHLEPDREPAFDAAALDAMHARVQQLVHHRWPDGSYTVFSTPDQRDAAVAYMRATGAENWVYAVVEITPERVLVSVVGDRVTDRALREFVEWAQARWPSTLYYGDARVTPAHLTALDYPS